jgi:hypothetical protein
MDFTTSSALRVDVATDNSEGTASDATTQFKRCEVEIGQFEPIRE